jgi:MFS family permease
MRRTREEGPQGSRPSSRDGPSGPSSVRRSLLLAHAAAAVALGGVQGILPALPEIQAALELSDAQIGAVNSAYLLPGVLLAIPAGFLADRLGRRMVYSGSLLLFGLAGAGVLLTPSFEQLLALRVLQGAAFAALLPLSVTIVGDLLSGAAQVREQGWRMLVITGSDTLLPLVGGGLVLLAWNAPFVLHTLALPLALIGWFGFSNTPGMARRAAFRISHLAALLRTRVAVAIQSLGVLRFLFKFAVLTYTPILMSQRGLGTSVIAVSISAMAAAAVVAALSTRWVLRRATGSQILAAALLAIAGALVTLAVVEHHAVMLVCLIIFGAAEGSFGIVLNAMTLEGVNEQQRATFVATVGALRNLGKFLAPALLGLAVLWMPLATAFVLVGVIAVASLGAVPAVRTLDPYLRREGGR